MFSLKIHIFPTFSILFIFVLPYEVYESSKNKGTHNSNNNLTVNESSINEELWEETMKNIFDKQVRWQNDIRDFCERNGTFSELHLDDIQSRLIIDQHYRFAYCGIPKVLELIILCGY